jgi:hypothetical protein
MNERIAKLYDQAIVIENGGDYVSGDLDPVKFAELIVQECINIAYKEGDNVAYLALYFGRKENE